MPRVLAGTPGVGAKRISPTFRRLCAGTKAAASGLATALRLPLRQRDSGRSARRSFRATLCPNSPAAQRPIPVYSGRRAGAQAAIPHAANQRHASRGEVWGIARRPHGLIAAGRQKTSVPREWDADRPEIAGKSLAPGGLANQRVRRPGRRHGVARRPGTAGHCCRRTGRIGQRLTAGARGPRRRRQHGLQRGDAGG